MQGPNIFYLGVALIRHDKSMIRPLLKYCDVTFDSCTLHESEQLDKIQREVSLLCTGAFRITSNEILFKTLGGSNYQIENGSHAYFIL